jgi:hypothetical protein|tara:strand:- start:30 stop:344 length:315 start_codon:yes stop_codon:yes gene_type:complete
MKLQKTIYQAKETTQKTNLDRSFNEMKKDEEEISVNKFFQYYNKLFFTIPKKGSQSHTTLFNNSGNYLDDPINSKDKKIAELQNKVLELELHISRLTTTTNDSE